MVSMLSGFIGSLSGILSEKVEKPKPSNVTLTPKPQAQTEGNDIQSNSSSPSSSLDDLEDADANAKGKRDESDSESEESQPSPKHSSLSATQPPRSLSMSTPSKPFIPNTAQQHSSSSMPRRVSFRPQSCTPVRNASSILLASSPKSRLNLMAQVPCEITRSGHLFPRSNSQSQSPAPATAQKVGEKEEKENPSSSGRSRSRSKSRSKSKSKSEEISHQDQNLNTNSKPATENAEKDTKSSFAGSKSRTNINISNPPSTAFRPFSAGPRGNGENLGAIITSVLAEEEVLEEPVKLRLFQRLRQVLGNFLTEREIEVHHLKEVNGQWATFHDLSNFQFQQVMTAMQEEHARMMEGKDDFILKLQDNQAKFEVTLDHELEKQRIRYEEELNWMRNELARATGGSNQESPAAMIETVVSLRKRIETLENEKSLLQSVYKDNTSMIMKQSEEAIEDLSKRLQSSNEKLAAYRKKYERKVKDLKGMLQTKENQYRDSYTELRSIFGDRVDAYFKL